MVKTSKGYNTKSLIMCSIFVALIAIGAFIKIPIPVVPFTLQLLFTTLAGVLLGSKLGSISVLVYIILGLIGMPIFTNGGGLGYILQPTFGYLIGFCLGAYLTGLIVEKSKNITIKSLLIANFVGLAAVYLIGMIYYYIVANSFIDSPIGVWSLILYCFILAIPGDIAICIGSAFFSKKLLKILKGGVR